MTMPYEEGAAGVVMYLEAEATKRSAELAHQLRTVTSGPPHPPCTGPLFRI